MTLDHATRRTGIGGSDLPVLLGWSEWKTPLDIWLAKTGQVPPSSGDNAPQEWGHRLEPVILQKLAERYKLEYHPHPGTVRAAHLWEHALYTPDALGDGFVAEAKSRSAWTTESWGADGASGAEVPKSVWAQCQWGMLLLNRPVCYLGVLIGGNDFRSYVIEHDATFTADALALAQAWWERHIVGGERPALDGGDGGNTWLRLTHPSVKDTTTVEITDDADPYLVGLVRDLVRLKTEITALTDQQQRLQQMVKAEIGGHAGIRTTAGTVTWLDRRGATKTDWESLAKHLGATPEHITQFSTTGSASRVLTVRAPK